MDKIFDLWKNRDPEWETRYQETVIGKFADYGKGVNKLNEVYGKLFGAGYEIFILAFFIGLYNDQTKPLCDDKSKRKRFGWAIENWGNIESRNGRVKYNDMIKFIFAALVAKCDVDWIALDKGEITPKSAVDKLIDKMEQYANFGFNYIKDKLDVDPNYFYKEQSFLRVFTSFYSGNANTDLNSDEPDSLDE